MKEMILGFTLVFLFSLLDTFQIDSGNDILATEKLKYVADEAAATAAMFYITKYYGEGNIIYDQDEGIEAAEYIIINNLGLDDEFKPQSNSYWSETISYEIYFFDSDSEEEFPYEFTDPDTGYTEWITEETVIVTINAGKARYRSDFISPGDIIRSSAYEYYAP